MKKLLAMILVLMLCMSCAAFATEADSEAARDTISIQQGVTTFKGTEEDGPFGRYAEPITITFVKKTDSTEMGKWTIMEEKFGETLEDNRWTRLFKDVLNINVEYIWTVDSSQYEQKWKLAMASGEIPDASAVSQIDAAQLYEAGLTYDMTEYWDKYASDLTKTVASADNGNAIMDCCILQYFCGATATARSSERVEMALWGYTRCCRSRWRWIGTARAP